MLVDTLRTWAEPDNTLHILGYNALDIESDVYATFIRADGTYEDIRSKLIKYLHSEHHEPVVHDNGSITIAPNTHITFGQTIALSDTRYLVEQCKTPEFKLLVTTMVGLLSDVTWSLVLSILSASDSSITSIVDMCARGAVKAVQSNEGDPIIRCQIIHRLMSIIDKRTVEPKRRLRKGKAVSTGPAK